MTTTDRMLEAYPAEMRHCPACDAPYGTVHGPDCVLDPESTPWMRQLLAKLDAVIADNGRLREQLAAPEGLDARSLYGLYNDARFPGCSPETAGENWDRGNARFLGAWEAVSSRASAAVAAVMAERDRLARLVAAAAYFAETWAELLEALPDSYDCTMNCPEANAAAEFLAAFGFGAAAREVAKAHAAHDTPGDEHYQGDAEDDGPEDPECE